MLRCGRGKQLVAMVADREIDDSDFEDTNKENRWKKKAQMKDMKKIEAENDKATMMVLKGASLELKEVSVPKLANNNFALDKDNNILISTEDLLDVTLGPAPDNYDVLQIMEINADTLDIIPQYTDLNAMPESTQEIGSIQHEDVFCGNNQEEVIFEHMDNSDFNLLCNEGHDLAETISSDQAIALSNIPEENILPIPDSTGLDEHNMTQCDNTSVSAVAIDQDPNNHNMDEGRKRKKKPDPSQWKRNLNKKLRMDGKPYLGFERECKDSKKVVQNKPKQGRLLKETCKSEVCKKSKNRNCDKFTEEHRREIFEHFWSISWKERKAFICAHVTQVATKRNTVSGRNSRRSFTMEYMLSNGCLEGNLQVCREMFLNTLGIGYRMMQLWVKKSSYNIPDTKTSDTGQRTSERPSNFQRTIYLKLFLDSLAKMPSHYARQNSSKLYLEPVFSTKYDVYKLYKGYCEEKLSEPFSFKKFCEVFDDQNLSLFCVKKDKCNTCSSHETGNISESEYKEHVAKKNRARQEKDQDKQKAEKGEVIILQVDFQAVKLSPFTYANAFYYKTKLACHNQTIMNVTTKHVKCYWFSEDQNNQLVASTFVSCLLDYLHNYCITQEKTPIIVYSDGCTAQNRNNILANALLNFSMITGIEIYQKFLEVGHTQMEVDSVHACIERKLKRREIKLPSDYVTITKEARISPSVYEAVELDYSFFKDYSKSEFLRYSSLRPGRTANDPCVTDIKVVFYAPEGIIKVKIDFSEDWMALRHRPKKIDLIHEYPPLFTERCKISKTKWQHLQELKTVIPKDCHYFYDNLPYI